jgi:ubiquinone/menaquinone biosynthesis C-methylase UbiE
MLRVDEKGAIMPQPSGLEDSHDRYHQYLRNAQYAAPDNLNARIRLHAKYSTAPQVWFEWLHAQIAWNGASDVLDVGCGTGAFWSTLPRPLRGARVVLADLSHAMVELATGAARHRVDRLAGVEANVQSLPFEDASFDVVIANHMLYHATDQDQAFREIRRILRPNGQLVASTIGPGHVKELFDIEQSVLHTPRSRILGEVFGPLSGAERLQRHFDAVEWRTYLDQLCCTDVEDVLAYITSTPPGDRATPEQRRDLRREIQQRIDDGGGVLTVTKESGVFLAHR